MHTGWRTHAPTPMSHKKRPLPPTTHAARTKARAACVGEDGERLSMIVATMLECSAGQCGSTRNIGMFACGHMACKTCVEAFERANPDTGHASGRACWTCREPAQLCSWAPLHNSMTRYLPEQCEGCDKFFESSVIRTHNAWCPNGHAARCPCGTILPPPVVDSLSAHVGTAVARSACAVIAKLTPRDCGPKPITPIDKKDITAADVALLRRTAWCYICSQAVCSTANPGAGLVAITCETQSPWVMREARKRDGGPHPSGTDMWRACTSWALVCGVCAVAIGARPDQRGVPAIDKEAGDTFLVAANAGMGDLVPVPELPGPNDRDVMAASPCSRVASFKLTVLDTGAEALTGTAGYYVRED